ncbi:hypothetical protein [uncultured Nostoc sp.]|uniref:hypothetical protein n=1 Tax=uncultured Nostoc sp. TaxID=340711 RepID=UPI0035CBA394
MPTVHSITLSGKDLSQLKLLWQEYGACDRTRIKSLLCLMLYGHSSIILNVMTVSCRKTEVRSLVKAIANKM